jgi:hypothetical protein
VGEDNERALTRQVVGDGVAVDRKELNHDASITVG